MLMFALAIISRMSLRLLFKFTKLPKTEGPPNAVPSADCLERNYVTICIDARASAVIPALPKDLSEFLPSPL